MWGIAGLSKTGGGEMIPAGIIFDLDGTLLDSMPHWEHLGEDYLRHQQIEPEPGLNEILRSLSLLQAADYFRNRYGIQKSAKTILEEIRMQIADFYQRQAKLKPQADTFVRKIRAMGIPCCLATATEFSLAQAALERTGILSLFQGILTCTQVGSGKENPEIFHAARAVLKTPQQQTLVFEDALHAILTAKRAGYPVAAISDKTSARDEIEIRKVSDYYFKSFSEAEELFCIQY